MDWLTSRAGPVAGIDPNAAGSDRKCYRRNGFTSDTYGYIGDEYTFVGNGYCLPAGSTIRYSHILHDNLLGLAYKNTTSVQICANQCRSQNNIEGQVGFDVNATTCFCRYTAGTGTESATSTEGMGSVTPATGTVAGTDSGNAKCYRRIAFVAQVSNAHQAGIDFNDTILQSHRSSLAMD